MTEVNLNTYVLGKNEHLVGLIGNGKMAFAIASGLIKNGLSNERIIVSGRQKSSFHEAWKKLEVKMTLENIEVFNKSLITILCCKPNDLKEVAEDITNSIDKKTDLVKYDYYSKTLISILKGVHLNAVKDAFSVTHPMEILRALTNSPLQVGCGCTAITPSEGLNKEIVSKIFQLLGTVEFVDEFFFVYLNGLSGSGPIYTYTMIEALTEAGVREGLPEQLAKSFATQTILGSARQVQVTEKHPAQLKNEICSPSGPTIKAVYELEKGGLRVTLMNAVRAVVDRTREVWRK